MKPKALFTLIVAIALMSLCFASAYATETYTGTVIVKNPHVDEDKQFSERNIMLACSNSRLSLDSGCTKYNDDRPQLEAQLFQGSTYKDSHIFKLSTSTTYYGIYDGANPSGTNTFHFKYYASGNAQISQSGYISSARIISETLMYSYT